MSRKTLVFLLTVIFITTLTISAFSTTTVKIWTWSQELKSVMEKVYNETMKDSGIKIEWNAILQSQYDQVLSLAFKSGKTPDIFFHAVVKPVEMAGRGWTLNLDEYLGEDFFKRFPAAYFYEGVDKINGHIVAIPAKGDYRIARRGWMYYNIDVLKKAGLDPKKDIPKTWGEFLKVAKKINEAGKGKFYAMVIPGTKSANIARTFRGITATLGILEPFIDWKRGEYDYDSPLWKKVYAEFMLPLVKDGIVPSGFASLDKVTARTMFIQGRTAFYFGGVWMPGVFKKMSGGKFTHYSVAPAPVPDDGRAGYYPLNPTSPPSWYVSSKTKHPKEAIEVLKFLASDAFQKELVKQGYDLSPLVTIDNAKITKNPVSAKIIKLSPEISRIAPIPQFNNPEAGFVRFPSIHPNVWEIIGDCLIKKSSPDEFAKRLMDLKAKSEKALDEEIQKVKAKGYNVSRKDFIFPDWDPLKDYVPKK